MFGAEAGVAGLFLPGLAVGAFGESVTSLLVGSCGQRVRVGGIAGIDRGPHKRFRDVVARRGAALDGVDQVVEHHDAVIRCGLKESGGGVAGLGGPSPCVGERFARDAGTFRIIQVELVDLAEESSGDR